MTAGEALAQSPEPLKLKKVSWLARRRCRALAAELNRDLLTRLAAWNMNLWSPGRIMAELELTETDLAPLRRLALEPGGWLTFEFDARAGAEAGRLAALGLVSLAPLRRRIRLTEAGRFLLSLLAIDPQIKKSPAAGRAERRTP